MTHRKRTLSLMLAWSTTILSCALGWTQSNGASPAAAAAQTADPAGPDLSGLGLTAEQQAGVRRALVEAVHITRVAVERATAEPLEAEIADLQAQVASLTASVDAGQQDTLRQCRADLRRHQDENLVHRIVGWVKLAIGAAAGYAAGAGGG